ncbi:MAG TPA: HAD family phosphatase [Thermoanaerobaculia bacterium]|nr:HAD family phosphatase [Thermoanaerobaculia bacterium]
MKETTRSESSPERSGPAIRAVLFDLGGVVLGSPLHAIAAFEADCRLEAGAINRHVAASAPDGAWHRLERGEITLGEQFFACFDAELAGEGLTVSSRDLMARIAEVARPRPRMLEAIAGLRAAGYVVAALTNNWSEDDSASSRDAFHIDLLRDTFDHVVESRKVGLRKPDPEIYRLTCEVLGVEPAEVVFLDDIGSNLKSARALGMATIKVDDPDDALAELDALLGGAIPSPG